MTRSICLLLLVSMWAVLCYGQLTVTTPNGGEVYTVGQTVTLRWSGTAFPDSVRIEYSTNAGATWTEIVRNWQQTSYRWLVPNTPSTQCLLRVTGPLRSAGTGVVQLRDQSRPQPVSHNSIDLTNDGTRAVVADEDGYVMLFDAVSGALLSKQLIQSQTGLGARVVRAVLSSDETWIAALTENDSVFVLRMPDLAVLEQWSTGIPKRVSLEDRWIATQPNGTRIGVSSFTHSRTFERNGTVVADITALNTSSNTCIDWTPDGTQVVVGSGNQGHVRSNATSGATLLSYPAPAFYGFVSPNGQYLASQAKNTQAVLVRDLATGATVGTIPSAPGILPFGLAWLPNNTLVRCTGPIGGVLERYAADGTFIDTLTKQPFTLGTPTFNGAGDVIGAASSGFSAVIRTAGTSTQEQDVSNAVWEIRAAVVSDTATLRIDSVSTTTLQDVRVPIHLTPSNATILNGVTSLDVTIAWNATMAVENGGTSAGSVVNGVRTVQMNVPVTPTTGDIVGYLDLRTALGTDSVTSLRIVDVTGVSDPTRIVRINGKLLLTDLCTSGGARFMNGDGVASMMIRSDGSVLRMSWNTIEDGAHDILVMDIMGRVMYQQAMELRAGHYDAAIDLQATSNGLVFVALRTPTIHLIKRAEVVR